MALSRRRGRDGEVDRLVQVVLLDVRQQVRLGREPVGVDASRELAVGVVVVVQGQPDLLQVVLALHPGGGLADLLDGGQQQADQDRDDRDHDQQLDQREPGSRRGLFMITSIR